MGKRSIKVALAIICVAAGIGGSALVAYADSPHFVQATGSFSGSDLVVNFKEAGLGNNQLVDYRASADATATYGCINKGKNHPQAQNKESVSGPVTATGTFSSGKNGQVTASLTLHPPLDSTLVCPDDMVVVLLQVSYTNVSLTDTTHGISAPIAGTFTYTNTSVKF